MLEKREIAELAGVSGGIFVRGLNGLVKTEGITLQRLRVGFSSSEIEFQPFDRIMPMFADGLTGEKYLLENLQFGRLIAAFKRSDYVDGHRGFFPAPSHSRDVAMTTSEAAIYPINGSVNREVVHSSIGFTIVQDIPTLLHTEQKGGGVEEPGKIEVHGQHPFFEALIEHLQEIKSGQQFSQSSA